MINNNESSDKLLLYVAVFASLIAVVGAGFTYFVVDEYKQSWNTGFATESGQVNITVEVSAAINFTQNFINISNGSVDESEQRAIINTADGTVTGGSFLIDEWPRNYMLIENIGNVNVTLNLSATNDAADFLGGADPLYMVNISNNNTLACVNSSMGTEMAYYNLSTWINITTVQRPFCDYFKYEQGDGKSSAIRLDVYLQVPKDSKTGSLTSTIQGYVAMV